jgi:DNA replication protein DnaC
MSSKEDHIWQEMGLLQRERSNQPLNPLSPGAVVPMAGLVRPNTSKIIEPPADQGDYCGYCQDLGYMVSEGIVTTLFEEPAFIEFQTRRACLDCKKGRKYLAEWQEHAGCDCLIGWVKSFQTEKTSGGRMVEVAVIDNCTRCEFGQELARRLEAFIKTRKQARLNKLMANAGLSEEIASMTFPNFDCEVGSDLYETKGKVYLAATNSQSILLMGNPGRGKTHLAAAYLNLWMGERGKTGVFVSLVDLMSSLRRTIRATEGPDWDTLLDRYVMADLLVLDDLGQEKATEKVSEVVFHLINSRINQRKPTVVTTNYNLKALAADVGYPPSICSRLASFERITWDSGDYRLKNRGMLKVVDAWDRP